MSAVWIDERKRRNPERMRRAMSKAHQARIERHYTVYRNGRPYKRPVSRRAWVDYLWAAWIVIMLGVLAGLTG